MDDIAKQLELRDSLRRKLNWANTPEQRVAEFARMQDAARELLRQSPDGYQHFLRRNLKARAIDVRDVHATR